MQNFLSIALVILGVVGLMNTCSGPREPARVQTSAPQVQVIQRTIAAEGLDLQAIGALAVKSKDAQSFEKTLNHPDSMFNNLDLNEDKKVDYLHVREYGQGDIKGLALYTELAPGDIQEIAEIEFSKTPQGTQVAVAGNSQVYGSNHYHSYSYGSSFMTGMMIGWIFSPHSMYYSPFGYGRYPGYYGRGYSRHSGAAFNSKNRSYKSANAKGYSRPSSRPHKMTSPLKGKSSSKVKAKLRNPTTSQKSFQKRQSTRVKSGGFGKSSGYKSNSRSMRGFGRSGGFRGGK